MSHSEIEPAREAAIAVVDTSLEDAPSNAVEPDAAAQYATRHAAPPMTIPAGMRLDPGADVFADVVQGSPHPRWIDSSRAKVIEGHAIAVQLPPRHQPRRLPGSNAEAAASLDGEPPRRAMPPRPEPAQPQADVPPGGFWRSHGRKAAAVAAVLGLCAAAGSIARLGHADTAGTIAAAPAVAVAVKAAESKESESVRQIAQMALDMRLILAKVETLRAEIERTRYADDTRGLKKSVDALRSGLEFSKSEAAAVLGQMAQKLDRLQQREPSAKLAQIADRLERMERRTTVSNEVTGSIARPAATAVAVATPLPVPKPTALAHMTSTPSDLPTPPLRTAATSLPGPKSVSPSGETEAKPEPKPQPKVIQGLVLRDVEGGVAIVEGRGGIFGISRGDVIPGIGRVEGIERRGREMVVVTSRGLITTHMTQR